LVLAKNKVTPAVYCNEIWHTAEPVNQPTGKPSIIYNFIRQEKSNDNKMKKKNRKKNVTKNDKQETTIRPMPHLQ